VRRVAIAALCLALLTVGCGVSEGGDCAKENDCAQGLTCSPLSETCLTPSAIRQQRTEALAAVERGIRAEAEAARALKASWARTDSSAKQREPKPSPAENTTVGCLNSAACEFDGRCSVGANGMCCAKKDADCRDSFGCTESGLCSAFGCACVARTRKDCRKSVDCKQRRKCRAVDGECVK
jgi:hypothetical protein